MRVSFVEGVLVAMVFRFMFNVCSLPLMSYVLYVLGCSGDFLSLTFLGFSV